MPDDPNLTTTEENPFAEWYKKFEAQNNERMNRTEAVLQNIAHRISWLPTPGQQAPPEPESVFVDQDRAIEQRVQNYIAKNVAPAMQTALQGTFAANRFLARQQAATDPAVADVFKHFGPDVDKRMLERVAQGGHVDPSYWIDAAKIIKADKGEELTKLKISARDIHTEGAGQRGAPATTEVTELPPDAAEAALRMGLDPADKDTVTKYNKVIQMRRAS